MRIIYLKIHFKIHITTKESYLYEALSTFGLEPIQNLAANQNGSNANKITVKIGKSLKKIVDFPPTKIILHRN